MKKTSIECVVELSITNSQNIQARYHAKKEKKQRNKGEGVNDFQIYNTEHKNISYRESREENKINRIKSKCKRAKKMQE